MIKILHIIDKLSTAGPTRSLFSAVKSAAEQNLNQQHQLVTLQEKVYPLALIQAQQANIKVFRKPEPKILLQAIENADIVQIHFWNNPEIYEFIRSELPPMRLLLWLKIFGEKPPQVITPELLAYSDFCLATSDGSLQLPVFRNLKNPKFGVVYGMADWDRLVNFQPKPHQNFNVGYIGTVNFAKMNPNYIAMSAAITVPNLKFIVCGGGIQEQLQKQAEQLGTVEKFDFRGYVENIKTVLEVLDVFGYPLCEDTYATSEKSLQEAMYAGIPPVVFPYGGVKYLIKHNETGLIVESDLEYKQAIEYLYYHPQERLRLGNNARDYALKYFNTNYWTQQLHEFYQQMMLLPKQEHSWRKLQNLSANQTPSEFFIETLGQTAPQFQESLRGTAIEDLLVAESRIACSSALLTGGEGGIMQYRNFYPQDPFLRLWSGLVLQQQQRHSLALQEFTAAIELGGDRPSNYWYIAQSAFQLGDFPTAKAALHRIIQELPSFSLAQEMLKYLP